MHSLKLWSSLSWVIYLFLPSCFNFMNKGMLLTLFPFFQSWWYSMQILFYFDRASCRHFYCNPWEIDAFCGLSFTNLKSSIWNNDKMKTIYYFSRKHFREKCKRLKTNIGGASFMGKNCKGNFIIIMSRYQLLPYSRSRKICLQIISR